MTTDQLFTKTISDLEVIHDSICDFTSDMRTLMANYQKDLEKLL